MVELFNKVEKIHKSQIVSNLKKCLKMYFTMYRVYIKPYGETINNSRQSLLSQKYQAITVNRCKNGTYSVFLVFHSQNSNQGCVTRLAKTIVI